ncbi:MAG TPA: hypothetical protein ENI63_00965 [Candidatus Kaiserbacteria bacterium]|nr:hypothetical protein [Candidatus Kaiserbacteria bacterium]
MLDPMDYMKQPWPPPVPHYHGDTIQILFLIGGIIILATLPFFKNLLQIGTGFLPVFVVLFVLGGAIVNPFQRWIIIVDLIIAAVAVILFEYAAVIGFGKDIFFLSIIRQVLAIMFLFALYYSGRTLRAMFMNQIGKKNGVFANNRKNGESIRKDE